MKLTVVHLEGSKQGLTETLTGQVITIGRDPSNTLSFDPFKDLDVSSRHATISVQGAQPTLQDLGSTNGTWLNGAKISGAVPLPNGCMIQFGENGPKLQATWSLEEGPGKKTKMIHDLSHKLDEAGATRTSEKKRNLLIILAVVLIGTLVGIAYAVRSSGIATQKLMDETARLKVRAEDQKSQAKAQKAATTPEAKTDWEAGLASMTAAEEAETSEDYEKAKAEYDAASASFQKAGTAGNNATMAALEKSLQEAGNQAKESQADKEKKDAADRKTLDDQNAAMLAKIRKELASVRKVAELLAYLETVDRTNPKALEEAISKTESMIGDLDPSDPERKQLEDELAKLKAALEKLSNVAERLKAAAEAAKPKTVGVRSHVFAIPKGQTLKTTKIRITVAEGVGSGFFVREGKVITAKEVVYPELFDGRAAALKSKLDEKGMQFMRTLEVLTAVKTSTATVYTATYTGDQVSIAREGELSLGDKQTVKLSFDNADHEITVRLHKRGDTDIVILKVEDANHIKPLELSDAAPRNGLPVAALGTQKREDGTVGLFRFDGKVTEGDAVLTLELPSFSSWIGGPLVNPDGKVVGILISPDLKASKAVGASAFKRFLD